MTQEIACMPVRIGTFHREQKIIGFCSIMEARTMKNTLTGTATLYLVCIFILLYLFWYHPVFSL